MKLTVLLCALLPFAAAAGVVDSGPNGFVVKTTVTINAAPQDVYRRIIHNVGEWWDPVHTFSGDARNLSIEEKPMGCFCEKLPDQGAVRHMEVVNYAPGKTLVMTGALGPLQSMAANGNMTIRISPAEAGSKVEVTYAVTGYLAGGMNALATPVDGVVAEQFSRLKTYIERK